MEFWFEVTACLPYIWSLAYITCEFVNVSFFVLWWLIWYCELVKCSCGPKGYAYVGVFEQIGDFSCLWSMKGERSPVFFCCLSVCVRSILCCICRFSFWSRFCGKLLFWLFLLFPILFVLGGDLVEGSTFWKCGLWGLPFCFLWGGWRGSW